MSSMSRFAALFCAGALALAPNIITHAAEPRIRCDCFMLFSFLAAMPEAGVTASRRIPFRFVENRVRKEYSDRNNNYRRRPHGKENLAQRQRQGAALEGGYPPIWGAGGPTAGGGASAVSQPGF